MAGLIFIPAATLIALKAGGALQITSAALAKGPVNEEIKARMEKRFGQGFEYAYFIPGMQKVIQAAGRVIRTESDAGVVMLLDKRYAKQQARTLMQNW